MTTYLPEAENFLGLSEELSAPASARVVVLPVPFEATSTYGPGSSGGPIAILDASHQVELFDAALGFEPFRTAGGIATRRPLDSAGSDGQGLAERLRENVKELLEQGRFVIVLGGEHTSVVGTIWAHCGYYANLTVLQLDAHSDLRGSYLGSSWNHACAMARVIEFHGDLVQVGVRSQAAEERAIVEQERIPVFYAHEIHAQNRGMADWIGPIIEKTKPRVYVTLDCDVMDPSVVPATGTPEPGGLTWAQIDRLLSRLCREREVVGMDVAELAPIPGLRHPQFTVAKLLYRFLGYRFPSGL